MSAQVESGRPPDRHLATGGDYRQESTSPKKETPSSIQREPSQQDLEIARQLQHFQSQGTEQNDQSRGAETTQHQTRETQPESSQLEASSLENAQHNLLQAHSGSPAPSDASIHTNVQSGQICTNCGTTKTPLWRRSPAGAVICNACGLYYKARNQMRPVGLKRSAGSIPVSSTSPKSSLPQTDRGNSPPTMQVGATYVSADQSTNGTCPGGGRCNGTGGHEGCNGCPAYNNRISKTAQVALRQSGDRNAEDSTSPEAHTGTQPNAQTVVVACQNCGTTITPLWRRDEAGNAICNACGLYYKLHGQHRPVQMKKAEIKRRKRVVPASMDMDTHHAEFGHGTTDIDPQMQPYSPSNVALVAPMEPRTGPGPIPVDFTDTFRQRSRNEHDSQTVPIKRNFSAINSDSEPYAHAQNVTFSAINGPDPALPVREGANSKEVRRAELEREELELRQMLERKQKELAALRDDT